METHAHAISTHPHHNDQPTMPHANEMSLHTTQSIGPIKLLLPTTICFCLLLFNIGKKYSKSIVLLSLALCYIDLGMKVTLLKNVLHLTGILLAIQIERCTLLQTIAYFLKHDVIKLFQPQHNGDSTTHQNKSNKPTFQYWTQHFHCYQD